jgi:hypothetical protein
MMHPVNGPSFLLANRCPSAMMEAHMKSLLKALVLFVASAKGQSLIRSFLSRGKRGGHYARPYRRKSGTERIVAKLLGSRNRY